MPARTSGAKSTTKKGATKKKAVAVSRYEKFMKTIGLNAKDFATSEQNVAKAEVDGKKVEVFVCSFEKGIDAVKDILYAYFVFRADSPGKDDWIVECSDKEEDGTLLESPTFAFYHLPR
jgi:hypothetical protein